jgi:hypothetical protein
MFRHAAPFYYACRPLRWFLVLLPVWGCGPKIQEFKVAPRRVCAGDTVYITFKTRGTPHLVAIRRPGSGADTTGSSRVDTTQYILVAESHGKLAHKPSDVITFSPSASPELFFDTDVRGDSLIATGTASPEAWPSSLRLSRVVSASDRALVVTHGGKAGVVPLGPQGSDVWAGMPVSGPWELHAGLQPGERIGDPEHSPPAILKVRLGLACGAEGDQP